MTNWWKVIALSALAQAATRQHVMMDVSNPVIMRVDSVTARTQLQASIAQDGGSRVIRTYEALPFIAAQLSPQLMLQLSSDVAYMDPVVRMHKLHSEQKNTPSWGLVRTSQKGPYDKAHTSYYYPSSAGNGTTVYVIDTGIQVEHSDFEGRASMMPLKLIPGEEDKDYDGHGTHVAGTIASKTYGIAKQARVVGVKALDWEGSGYDSDIIKGIDAVVRYKQHHPDEQIIINMSIGGNKSRAVNDAVDIAFAHNIVVVVASGNEGQDACRTSPASARRAFSVSAITKTDTMPYWSNWGKCVQIFAPGDNILSLTLDPSSKTNFTDGFTARFSGTSMASPHTAGVVALVMSGKNLTALEAHAELTRIAHKGLVQAKSKQDQRHLKRTKNLLLSNGIPSS